jgi:transposase-like protein
MASTSRHRPDKTLITWTRWLLSQGMPRVHVLSVLDLPDPPPPHVARLFHDRQPGAPLPRRPSPDRRAGRRPPRRLRCRTASKARRLTELGYTPAAIARLLRIPRAALDRWHRTGSHRMPPPTSPWYPTGRKLDPRYTDPPAVALGERPEALDPPAASPIVGTELAADALGELAEPHRWEGLADPHHRGPRALTAEQITEARELLLSGLSYRAAAQRLGVSVGTVRRHAAVARPRAQYDRYRRIVVRCGCGRERSVLFSTTQTAGWTGQCRWCARR